MTLYGPFGPFVIVLNVYLSTMSSSFYSGSSYLTNWSKSSFDFRTPLYNVLRFTIRNDGNNDIVSTRKKKTKVVFTLV